MIMEMKDLPTDQSGRVRDQRIGRIVELISPAQILEDLPLSAEQEDAVLTHRTEVARVLDRKDDRLLVVVGPTTSVSRCGSTSRNPARPLAGRG